MKRQGTSAIRALRLALPGVFALCCSLCTPALATGFFINQQNVKGLGRVDAGNAASADDLGTIFFNPAGMIELWRAAKASGDSTEHRFSLGTHLIVPRSRLTNTGSTVTTPGSLGLNVPVGGGDAKNPTNPTPVPNLYFTRQLANGQAAIGIGVNAPFGLAAKYNDDWHGRYDATKVSLETYNLSLVGAYRFADLDGRLSVGGGLDLQYAKTTLATAIPNPLAPGGATAASDGRIETNGTAWTPGFNLGLLYSLGAHSRVGIHYRSAMTHRISGSSSLSGLAGPLASFNGSIGAKADLKLPAIASLGFLHRLTPELVLLSGIDWFNWKRFNEVRIRFDDGRADGVRATNYRDTYTFSIGAEYRQPGSAWTARGGVKYDRTPTVDGYRDTTVPDSDRVWLGLGFSYRWSNAFNVDFAFNHVFFRRTNIAVTRTFFDGTALATTTRTNSDVRFSINTVALDFRFVF